MDVDDTSIEITHVAIVMAYISFGTADICFDWLLIPGSLTHYISNAPCAMYAKVLRLYSEASQLSKAPPAKP